MNPNKIKEIENIFDEENPLDRNSDDKFCIVIKKGILSKLAEIQNKNYDFSSYIFKKFDNDVISISHPKYIWLNYQINSHIEDDEYDVASIKIKNLLETYFDNKNSIILRTISNNYHKSISLKIITAKLFLINCDNVKNEDYYSKLKKYKIPIDLNLKNIDLKEILKYQIKSKENNLEIKMIYLFENKPKGMINYYDFKSKTNLLDEEEKQIKNFSNSHLKVKFFVFCNETNKISDIKILLEKNNNNNNNNSNHNYRTYESTYNHENKGLCGLKNIGNTCYMNSALQCLSNTNFLKDYFVSKSYQLDINNNNVLGYEGKIAISFENLLKNLWKTNAKSYNPGSFKKEISKTNPMFEGYHQNDSQEFLSHLIDCLHEDLSLIKKKPMTEQIEKKDVNDNDYEIAKKSWINHLKRNYSVINRIFYGQFKSEVNCPRCKKLSITFDSFQIIPLSIPQIKEKEIKFYVNSEENFVEKICYNLKGLNTIISNLKLSEIKKDYCESINENPDDYFVLNVDSVEIADDSRFNVFDIKNNNLDISIFKYSDEDKEILSNIPKENQILVKMTLINISYCLIMEITNNIGDLKERIIKILKSFLDKNKINNFEEYIEIKKSDYSDNKYDDNELLKDLIQDDNTYKYYNNYNRNKNINMLKFDNKIEVSIKFNRKFDKKHEISNKIPSKYPNYNQAPVKNNKTINFNNNTVKDINNLLDLIDLFVQKEELDDSNKWYCNICKDHLKAIKKIDFYKLPPILIFQMKKLKGEYSYWRNNNKNENSIDFPINSLDMSKYVKNKKNFDEYNINKNEFLENYNNTNDKDNVELFIKDNDNLEYELYGVINHYGSMNFGHYTAYSKNENQWYEYDDSTVSQIDENKIVNSSAYILFYRKKNLNN